MASRGFTVDSAKKNKFVDIFLLMPETGVADAMRSAKFTKEDIPNLQMWLFLQRPLLGGSIKGLKAYVAGLLCPMQLVDDAAIVANVDAAIVHVEHTPPVTVNAVINVEPRVMVNSGLTGRRGVKEDFASSACAALSPQRRLTVSSTYNQQSGSFVADYWAL
jgi:hypothetical protein